MRTIKKKKNTSKAHTNKFIRRNQTKYQRTEDNNIKYIYIVMLQYHDNIQYYMDIWYSNQTYHYINTNIIWKKKKANNKIDKTTARRWKYLDTGGFISFPTIFPPFFYCTFCRSVMFAFFPFRCVTLPIRKYKKKMLLLVSETLYIVMRDEFSIESNRWKHIWQKCNIYDKVKIHLAITVFSSFGFILKNNFILLN